jgi:hypothetical protein
MLLDLPDDELAALRDLLRRTIDNDPFPLSPRLRAYRAILARIDPTEPYPAPQATVPSTAMAKKRRR